MFWILRKWSPWQRGACERTSFFVDTSGFRLPSDITISAPNRRCCLLGTQGKGAAREGLEGGGVQTEGHTDSIWQCERSADLCPF